MARQHPPKTPNFYLLSLPFSIVNGVVWGIGIVSLPLLAGTPARSGLTFAMINLGIAIGAVIWGHFSPKFKLSGVIFTGTVLSFSTWLLLVLFNGKFLIPLAFIFGLSAAGIFALASVMVTNTYPKELWDNYIAKLQSFMTLGTVVGLLITVLYAKAVIGLPFLFIAILAYLPFIRHHPGKTIHHPLHLASLKPKMHFAELFNGYFHVHIKWRHLLNFKDNELLYFNIRWLFIMLAPAPVYAMYPLLMKKAFHLTTSESSFIYAVSTGVGVFLFLLAGKLSKKKSPFFTFNTGVWLYIATFVLMIAGMWLRLYFLGAAGFMIMIFSWSFISTGMNIGIVELTDEHKRGEALGIANSVLSLDNVIGGAAGGWLVSLWGFETILWIGTGFSLLALLANFIHRTTSKKD